MKTRHFFAILAAALTMTVACTVDEIVSTIDGIDLSASYVSVSADGGSAAVNVVSDYGWTASVSGASWLTVTPASASAGQQVTINFAAVANTGAARNAEVMLKLDNGQVQIITVAQGGGEPSPSTCAEVIAGDDGAAFKVTGVITKISNTHYGNWYINDGTGEVYVYGTCDKKGNTNSSSNSWDNINDASYESSWDLSVGDQVTIQGPKTTYNGTVELVDVTILDVQKSLIKCDSLSVSVLPIEGGETVAALMCKGNGVTVSVPDDAKSWLSVTGIIPTDNGFDVKFFAQPNNEGDRETTLTFNTSKDGKDYSSEITLTQKGAILEVSIAQFNAAAVGNTIYRVSGMVSRIGDASKGRFYIKDWSGETYVYNMADFASLGVEVGDIITITGKRDQYNTTIELTSAAFESKIDVTEISIAEFLAKDKSNSVWYRLTGTITSIAKGDYGNLYIQDEDGNEVYVYGVYSGYGATGDNRKYFLSNNGIEVGDVITVEGYKDIYNGTHELCGGVYVSHSKPQAAVEYTYKKVSAITSGKSYLMVAAGKAAGLLEGKTYGYLAGTEIEEAEGEISGDFSANEIVITSVEGGYTMAISGQYLYQSGTYNSFNWNEAPSSGQVWSFEAQEDGTFKVTNNAVSKWIQWDPNYGSWGSYPEDKGEYPVFFEKQ